MTPEVETFVSAFNRLVRKLEEIEQDPQFQSIWVQYFIHGGKYIGPNWRNELDEARKLLAQAEVLSRGPETPDMETPAGSEGPGPGGTGS